MSDSTGAEQDGAAAETVEKSRFDGLMSSHQKALAENAALKARLGDGGQGQGSETEAQTDDDTTTSDSQQTAEEFEDGAMFEVVDGKLSPWEPPQPTAHNEARTLSKPTEPTYADLDRIVGKPTLRRGQNDWDLS